MSKLLFYPCDARKHFSGKVFYRFRDFSDRIFMSNDLKNAYQDISDTLKVLVTGKIICGENIPTPSPRLEHEFVVEVPVNKRVEVRNNPVPENSPTAGNSQI
ncbi:hypothetical protein EV673_0267 [Limnobacter thiooxidans]|uniref:Uncharacterized protein n=1 Tax=Limnobacter thiooxidans TaxID=131080 RepID=A0AA86JL76_9BURK|nr:hypothetical protein [Limnobacter sp.]MCZ8014413.1 hypothetical protein [Limnobacter sp.]RZS41952.1 hypothetical protein EV673_0267 [Limnobacter thiooxidans]BET26617.1 hypothetical protein RGQ30_21180 [Limnobacter thiooxidans]